MPYCLVLSKFRVVKYLVCDRCKKSKSTTKSNNNCNNYTKKRKPINFTIEDLDADMEEDGEFRVNVKPTTSRTMPKRKCKDKIVIENQPEYSD